MASFFFFFFQAEDGIRDLYVTGVQTCALPISFLEAIKEALQNQKNIEVRGFGTFKIRHRKTRMARNPRTGSPVEVSARPVPVFKPSKELRAMVAGVDEKDIEDEAEEIAQ